MHMQAQSCSHSDSSVSKSGAERSVTRQLQEQHFCLRAGLLRSPSATVSASAAATITPSQEQTRGRQQRGGHHGKGAGAAPAGTLEAQNCMASMSRSLERTGGDLAEAQVRVERLRQELHALAAVSQSSSPSQQHPLASASRQHSLTKADLGHARKGGRHIQYEGNSLAGASMQSEASEPTPNDSSVGLMSSALKAALKARKQEHKQGRKAQRMLQSAAKAANALGAMSTPMHANVHYDSSHLGALSGPGAASTIAVASTADVGRSVEGSLAALSMQDGLSSAPQDFGISHEQNGLPPYGQLTHLHMHVDNLAAQLKLAKAQQDADAFMIDQLQRENLRLQQLADSAHEVCRGCVKEPCFMSRTASITCNDCLVMCLYLHHAKRSMAHKLLHLHARAVTGGPGLIICFVSILTGQRGCC